MPDRVTTSFIPKEALVTERSPRNTKRSPFAFVNLIAGAILVISILAAGGIFLFKTYTVQSIASKQDSLERQRAAFEPATIQELSRLDRRITAASDLLKKHLAASQLFSDLEARTGVNVRFRDFKLEPSGGGRIVVSMSGSAKSFNSVALQSDVFGKSTVLKDPIFSNLNIDQSGNVVFAFTAVIDPARLRYASSVSPTQAPVDTVVQPQSTTTQP